MGRSSNKVIDEQGAVEKKPPLAGSVLQQAVSKVPLVTGAFWVTKVLTTGMGESVSDFRSYQLLGPLVVLVVCFVGLVAGLVLQIGARRYVPWIYWPSPWSPSSAR